MLHTVPDSFALEAQSLRDLRIAELDRHATRLAAIIARRGAELRRVRTAIAILRGAPVPTHAEQPSLFGFTATH